MNLFTLREVTEMLKVSESTVRRWILGGSLKAYKVGQRGQLRIREEDLDLYLEAQIVRVDSKDNENMKGIVSQNKGDSK